MRRSTFAGSLLVLCLLFPPSAAAAADEATLFRVFLKDGGSLVSYGEFARVNDRVVFSMPTSALPNPRLTLVDLAADRVDWDRTNRYAESARAAHYIETRAGADYVALSNQVSASLNAVAAETDLDTRIAIVQRARQTLADWPAMHYNYKLDEIRQMLGMLDEAMADLRAKGTGQFDLTLSTYTDTAGAAEAMLPTPTPQGAIEQTLLAAKVADSPDERTTLLGAALESLDADADVLPSEWLSTTRAETAALVATEQRIDRQYRALSTQMTALARQRAEAADVRGIDRLFARIYNRDAVLGLSRPEIVNALVSEVQKQLDAARALRLARDHWALRAPALRAYGVAIAPALGAVASLKAPLQAIEDLSGSSAATLASIDRVVKASLAEASAVEPPPELQAAHAMLVSAMDMAGQASRLRREAALAEDMTKATDAASMAAGALSLAAEARADIRRLLLPPKLR